MTSKAFGLAQLSNAYADGALSNRNKIINGAMTIDQRRAGAALTPAANGDFLVDRFVFSATQTSRFFGGQNYNSVTTPAGFTNYAGVQCSTSQALGASDFFGILQRIEGFNVADLAWGSASAVPVTLTFRVYSSLTGTFGGSIRNNGATRSYPFSYSVASANTWTTVSITVPGDTSGTWLTNNGMGLQISFGLGVGSNFSGTADAWAASSLLSSTGAVSVVGTQFATFYITGVQLEAGDTATPFEHRSYGAELALCQRYYWGFGYTSQLWRYANHIDSTSIFSTHFDLPVTMRAAPTVSTGTFTYRAGSSYTNGTVSSTETNQGMVRIVMSCPSAPNTAGYGALMLLSNNAWSASAEL
jgi:hypothetical protein